MTEVHARKHSVSVFNVNSATLRHGCSVLLSNQAMPTAEEHRGTRLLELVREHGSYAALNRALGRGDRDATLGQIGNAAPDSKTGKPRQMGKTLARAIEAKLNLPVGWMDGGDGPAFGHNVVPYAQPTQVHDTDEASVPMLDLRASAGLGQPQPGHDPVVGRLRLSREWMRRALPRISSPDNLATLIAYGPSMEPTFSDGSILLVDTGVREVRVDAIYVIERDRELFVKRLQRRLTDGALLVISDNPHYQPETLMADGRYSMQVLGRVVWAFDSKGV